LSLIEKRGIPLGGSIKLGASRYPARCL